MNMSTTAGNNYVVNLFLNGGMYMIYNNIGYGMQYVRRAYCRYRTR